MLAYLLIGLAVLVLVFLVVAAFQPTEFQVERSTTVSAAAAAAFAQVNDLHKWQEMSPYVKLDPAANYTFEGPSAGVGASMAWVGNKKLGIGRITVIESRPNELVRMKLDFVKPYPCNNTAEFCFRSAGGQTAVTWTLLGRNNFMGKAVGLLVNMDKMIGREFENGLANLKRIVEGPARS